MRILITLLVFFLITVQLKAQEKFVDDASLWLGINIEKRISNKWNFTFSNQARYDRNITRYRMGYQDLGIDYKLFKFLHLQADYKLIHRQLLDESFSIRHQMNLALLFKKSFGPWSLAFRNRWQCSYRDVYSSPDGLIPQWVNRNKLTLKYELNKRLQLFSSGEMNYVFSPIQDEKWDRYRTSLGLEYKLNKNSSIECYYTFQRDLETDLETERFHIYGISYSIKI